MSLDTGWTKPPQQIRGLDHLGVQAPCIFIYSQLLPGITNVTDRARYYSFYPWLVSRFEKKGWRSETELLTMLRRSECLLTLIGMQHSVDTDNNYEQHAAAMVGTEKLSHAISELNAGQAVELSVYAGFDESPSRYFKNPVGGLGQYYFGTLNGLGILSGDSPRKMEITKQIGLKIARVVDQNVPGDAFLDVVESGTVTLEKLKLLSGFCFCKLSTATDEAEILIRLLEQGWHGVDTSIPITEAHQQANQARDKSIKYLCHLVNYSDQSGSSFDLRQFRAISYTGAGFDKAQINFPEPLIPAIKKWRTYVRNEILSVALQGIFFCILRAAELLSERRFANTSELSSWFWNEGPGFKVITELTLADKNADEFIEELGSRLCGFNDWQNSNHEVSRMERVHQLTNSKQFTLEQLMQVTENVLYIISALVFRVENRKAYEEVIFPEGYIANYPVNLTTVRDDWQAVSKEKPVIAVLAKFCQQRLLDAHLKVALRKLRQQGQNTFRFEPSEIGLLIKDIPAAAFTSPRFKQALKIITDLGILKNESGHLRLSSRGQDFIKDVA